MSAITINPQFVKDEKGREVGVFLTKTEFDKLLEESEDYEDIKAYDRAKSRRDEELIPYEQAIDEIKRSGLNDKLLISRTAQKQLAK